MPLAWYGSWPKLHLDKKIGQIITKIASLKLNKLSDFSNFK